MNLKKFAALILAFAMCLVSAGALAEETDSDARIAELEAQVAELEAQVAERDATIADLEHQLEAVGYVAEFDGGHVTVEEAMNQYEYVEYMYSTYGYSMDGYEDYIKQDIATSLLQKAVVEYMAAELGLDELTEEEAAELDAAVQQSLDMYVENYRSSFESDDKTEEEIKAETLAYLEENGVSYETLYEQELSYAISDAVYAHVVADVDVDDSAVLALYNQHIADDMTSYSDPSYYESAVMSGDPIYWHPEGYRNVRQVLVAFDDDQSARYDEITGRIDDLEAELDAAQNPEETEGSDETVETDGEAGEPRAVEEIQADLDAANAELDALYAELEPTAEEVVSKFGEGVSIDELISTYGGDPGSINEDGTTNTYVVSAQSASYDPAFVEAAMSVSGIGGLSEPTRGMYGLYIVYYDSDVTSGAVDYDAVYDELYAEALDNARAQAYDAQLEAWCQELNVVYYMENFR